MNAKASVPTVPKWVAAGLLGVFVWMLAAGVCQAHTTLKTTLQKNPQIRAKTSSESSPDDWPRTWPKTWPTSDCVKDAATASHVSPYVLLGVMKVEGGHPGQRVENTNGTVDMGPMQINSIWLPHLRSAGIGPVRLSNDGCINVAVGAAILAMELKRSGGNLSLAVGWYHSHTPYLAVRYRDKVRNAITELLNN